MNKGMGSRHCGPLDRDPMIAQRERILQSAMTLSTLKSVIVPWLVQYQILLIRGIVVLEHTTHGFFAMLRCSMGCAVLLARAECFGISISDALRSIQRKT